MKLATRLLSALLLIAASPLALAQAQYTYSGPVYTTFFSPYGASSRITGNFRLISGALAPNLNNANITAQVQSFSFTDGQATRTLADSRICSFTISTNGAGQITGQAIWLRQLTPGAGNQHNLETRWPSATEQSGFLTPPGDLMCGAGAQIPFGQLTTPATLPPWTVSGLPEPAIVTQIPTLSNWSKFGLLGGLLALSAVVLRRRH